MNVYVCDVDALIPLIERDVKGPYSFNTSKITFLFTISTPRDLILFLLYCVLLFFFEFTDYYIVYVHILVFCVHLHPYIGLAVYLAVLATSH